MHITIINPTTTDAFAQKNGEAGRRVAAPGTTIRSISMQDGPPSIEGHYDEVVAAMAVLDFLRRDTEATDGYVLACFGDPGIWAAREIARAPVLGIAEASFHMATMIATTFSVVTTLARTKVICNHLLHTLGFANRCARIRATDEEVLALENSSAATVDGIIAEARRAVAEDECGAIVLGCAGMADLVDPVSTAVGVPVVEGVAAAVKLLEGLAAIGLDTSRRGDLARPRAKTYVGRFADYSPQTDMQD